MSATIGRRQVLQLGGLTALAGLAGCSGKSLGDSGSGSGGGATQLQFMYWGPPSSRRRSTSMLKAFEQENTRVTVKPLFTPADYDTKLNTLVASNRAPDVAYMSADPGYRLAEQGKLVNLYDVLRQVPGRSPTVCRAPTSGGTRARPTAPRAPTRSCALVQQAGLADAGVDLPPAAADKAWPGTRSSQNAYKLTLDQNGKHPDEAGLRPEADPAVRRLDQLRRRNLVAFLLSNGIDFADEAGTKSLLDSPEAIEVFQNLTDLMYKHRVAPTPAQLGNNAPSTTVQLKTRRVAMVVDGQWTLLDLSPGQARLRHRRAAEATASR